jgi:predicted Zn-ribbon and HTH transcriptional regulator
MAETKAIKDQIKQAVDKVLGAIERERERDVVVRRFGLGDQKETLELVGETLGITRERVRQIEKATLIRAKLSLDDGQNPAYDAVEKEIVKALHELGRAAKTDDLTIKVIGENDPEARAALIFLSELSSKTLVTGENDRYHMGVVLSTDDEDKKIKAATDKIVSAIRAHGQPVTVDEMFELVGGYEHPDEVKALASLSKQVATLRGLWGLAKWPEVNPKNIRDKIMVVMSEHGKPMHFSEIAAAIKAQDFKRNDVTQQAIHNELIKDSRFILVGRGLYGLSDWGYRAGTLSEIITSILREESPLHREEIIRRVLKQRHIREATILLTLQNDKTFKRVSKSQYALAKK